MATIVKEKTAREQLEKHLIDVICDCEKWYKNIIKTRTKEVACMEFVEDDYIPTLKALSEMIVNLSEAQVNQDIYS